ncbi:hypothetical protein BLNAU_3186 [Blattamonas nauphoetae]|uniref:Uncharacterized protein n=1 Tax=Blattamonas nauphoetae TaxID=2049346 RepID=A0ABQ9YDE0_9EUKA|nr:hypothetical protein BLNAU_3186 [Blattamonas nauphoetae]
MNTVLSPPNKQLHTSPFFELIPRQTVWDQHFSAVVHSLQQVSEQTQPILAVLQLAHHTIGGARQAGFARPVAVASGTNALGRHSSDQYTLSHLGGFEARPPRRRVEQTNSPSSVITQPAVTTSGVIEQGMQLLEQLEKRILFHLSPLLFHNIILKQIVLD